MELKNDLLAEALQIAALAHQFTVDKQGHPYILHPLRVMMKLDDEAGRVVALLHDVIEDSGFILTDVQQMGSFSDEIMQAIDAITKRSGETLEEYWARVKENPLALRVKLVDIQDNMNRLDLLFAVNPKTAVRLYEKYDRALRFLETDRIDIVAQRLTNIPNFMRFRLTEDQDG